jgi:hypothetical protein
MWEIGFTRRLDVLPHLPAVLASLSRTGAILHASFRLACAIGRSGLLSPAGVLGWPFAFLRLHGLAALFLLPSSVLLGWRARLTLFHLAGLRRLLHLGRIAFHRRLASLLASALSRFSACSGLFCLSLGAGLSRSLAHLALASFPVLAALRARRRLLARLRLLRKGDRNGKSSREGRRGGGPSPRPSHDASPCVGLIRLADKRSPWTKVPGGALRWKVAQAFESAQEYIQRRANRKFN